MNVLIVVTGAASAAFAPYWANWLKMARPDVSPRYLMSKSAEKFVTATSLRLVSGAPVELDSFEFMVEPTHVRLADWMDALLVHPCSLSYLGRLAQGSVDVPSLMASACTEGPVVIAPALPPGANLNEPYRSHRLTLDARPDVHVIEPTPVRSAGSSRPAMGAAAMNECFGVLDEHVRRSPRGRPSLITPPTTPGAADDRPDQADRPDHRNDLRTHSSASNDHMGIHRPSERDSA
ncbi:MAG: flavoprotein [Actinomycetales bacterium]